MQQVSGITAAFHILLNACMELLFINSSLPGFVVTNQYCPGSKPKQALNMRIWKPNVKNTTRTFRYKYWMDQY